MAELYQMFVQIKPRRALRQITADVEIHTGGVLDLAGFNDTVGRLTVCGGSTIETGTGILTLSDDISSIRSFSESEPARIHGRLSLGGATQGFVGVFDVSVYPTAYVPPDSDGDQLPDDWEMEKTGGLAQLGTDTDSDNDGYGAFREYHLHLDPNAFSPTPATTIENGCVTTTVQKRPGLLYHISSGSDVAGWNRASARIVRETPTWMTLRDNLPTCSGTPLVRGRRFKTLRLGVLARNPRLGR